MHPNSIPSGTLLVRHSVERGIVMLRDALLIVVYATRRDIYHLLLVSFSSSYSCYCGRQSSPTMSDYFYIKCVGAIGALCGAMAWKMTLFRLAGSPGEGEEKSPLTKWYWAQQLTCEWASIGTPLLLALQMRNLSEDTTKGKVAKIAATVFTVTRFTFAIARTVAPDSLIFPLSAGSMVPTYAATFTMAGVLVA